MLAVMQDFVIFFFQSNAKSSFQQISEVTSYCLLFIHLICPSYLNLINQVINLLRITLYFLRNALNLLRITLKVGCKGILKESKNVEKGSIFRFAIWIGGTVLLS